MEGGATDSFLKDGGWGSGGTLQSPNNQATPQGMDQRLKIEDLREGSEAGQSREDRNLVDVVNKCCRKSSYD